MFGSDTTPKTGNVRNNVTLRRVLATVTYCECVSVALCILHAMRMLHIVICDCPAVQYFSTLFHKRHDFRKKVLNMKCVFLFSLQLLSETFLILRRIERAVIKNIC